MEWQHLAYSHEQVARNLGVDKSTVSCNLQLLNNTGTITKKAFPRDKAHKKLTIPAQLLFLNLVV
jgi:predicted transcriptional regulator